MTRLDEASARIDAALTRLDAAVDKQLQERGAADASAADGDNLRAAYDTLAADYAAVKETSELVSERLSSALARLNDLIGAGRTS